MSKIITLDGLRTFKELLVGEGSVATATTATTAKACTGNAATATKLQTARTINGTSFNGTANITTTNWGTARNISITDGTNTSTAVSVNGSADVALTLPATIKANLTGNCSGSSGSCTGNAATATTATTAGAVSTTVASDSTKDLVYARMADDDFCRIRCGGTSDAGYLEIATCDNGNEPIYVRQFNGKLGSVTRTLTLLDEKGNTQLPGTVTAPTFSGNLNGNAASANIATKAANADHAARADRATNADHAASADKTTGGTVNITGYVSGSGSFDRNGNVTVNVAADIRDTPYTYYVGKTNARDYWGKDENGNQWGSTKDHPFASLSYAINQSNSHVFPGNTITIYVNDSGEYADDAVRIFVTSNTNIYGTTSEHPIFRCWWDMQLSAALSLSAVDFAIRKVPTADSAPDGIPFFRVTGLGDLLFANGCHMVIDSDNFGRNIWPFIEMGGSSRLTFICNNGPALYLELRGNGVTHTAPYISFISSSAFGAVLATGPMAVIKFVSPSGTKHTGSVLSLDRFGEVGLLATPGPGYKLYFDWDIADDSGTSQVDLGKFAFLMLYKNPGKGQALPGSSVGNVPDLAEYHQWDYA